MDNLTLEKYFKDKQEIAFLYKSAKQITYTDELRSLLSRLSFLLSSSLIDYKDFPSFISLAEDTVYSIQKLNEDKDTDFQPISLKLAQSLSSFLVELSSRIQLDVYFYGKDIYNLMNKKYLRDNVYKLDDFNEVNYIKKNDEKDRHFTVLLLGDSVSFASELDVSSKFDEVFDYTKILQTVFDTSKSLYRLNYDYNYLVNELESSRDDKITSVIVGNGYTRMGLDINLVNMNAVNLSLPVQDLNHSFSLAKKAIEGNNKIAKCVVGVGYHSMYYDLLKSNLDESKRVIEEVYKPSLDSAERATIDNLSLEDYITNPIILEIFNLEELSVYMKSIHHILNKSYFNSSWTREQHSVLKSKNFDLMTGSDKSSLGIWRASQHNKYLDGFKRDKHALILDFLTYLESKNVTPIFIVFPVTNYYKRFLDDKYIKAFNEIMDDIGSKKEFKLIDLNNGYDFDDSDFIDVDHLNERGCIKATVYINNLLKWIK